MAVSYGLLAPRGSIVLGHIVSFVLLLVWGALQASWPTWLRLSGQPPDLVLATAIMLGLNAGRIAGLFAGFSGALIWASLANVPMGHLFISYMGLGYFAGALRGRLFSERLPVAMILAALGIIGAAIVQLIFAPPPSPQIWGKATLARVVYGLIITGLLFPIVRSVARVYPQAEEI